MKTILAIEPGERDAAVAMPQARHAVRVPEGVSDVCCWPTMSIGGLTMLAADAALASDPLFHLGPGGHLGPIEMRHWYFRPELKYLTCRACTERGDRPIVELNAVACQHRMPAG